MASEETVDPDNNLFELEGKNVNELRDVFKNLYEIWNKVGVDGEQKIYRATQVWGYVFNVLKEIKAEEMDLYEDIKERIRNYEKKISDLLIELHLPEEEEVSGSLITREETLRLRLDELLKIRHKRVKEFQELQAQEMKYCKLLGMPPLKLSSTTGVPSETDISEMQEHVKMLQAEKENRQMKFYRLKKELTTILEITELTPETPLEKELLSQEESVSLSTETFKMLELIVNKTKSKRADLEKEKSALIDKLTGFWDVMKVDENERKDFLLRYTDCRVSTLNAIRAEIKKYEEIRRQNITKYVDNLKEELMSLWNKCFVSQSESSIFRRLEDDEISEDILERYENEVAKWQKYYKDTEHIIKDIEKRQDLWEQVAMFELKASDPNRFKNRGGQLLQEERQRKMLKKLLPELEKKILDDIQKYEEETGKQFLYYGERFEDFLEKQWGERENLKEKEKLTRQKLRSTQLVTERNSGLTPAKRAFGGLTPKSAPSKMFKSSVGLPIYRTPNISTSRQIPSTIARLKNNKLPSSSACKTRREILREKNENKPKPTEGNNFDSTTYTEFADQLNRSSRVAHRSSVLSSRKIVGTRISTGAKNKRKSMNKSGQKSMQKKGNSSKLTPARGKLGLPFLI